MQVTYLEHGPVHLDGDRAWGTDPDTLRFVVIVDGTVHLHHADAEATLTARDSAIAFGTTAVTYSSDAPARIVTCDIPTDHPSLIGMPRSAPFVVGRADAAVPSAVGAVLIDLLRQNADKLDPLARAQTADVLRVLVSSTVMALAVEGCTGWEIKMQRQAAMRYIAAQYTDPELSSTTVAEHLGLSRRSLQRLFEDEERGVAKCIQDVRARQAISRLLDPRLALATLGEIATLSGFGTATAMRRAVQAATGKSPHELRREQAKRDADSDSPVEVAVGATE